MTAAQRMERRILADRLEVLSRDVWGHCSACHENVFVDIEYDTLQEAARTIRAMLAEAALP